jgi:hypothetical protein
LVSSSWLRPLPAQDRASGRGDHVHPSVQQIRRQGRKPINLAGRPTVFNLDVVSAVTGFFQPSVEGRDRLANASRDPLLRNPSTGCVRVWDETAIDEPFYCNGASSRMPAVGVQRVRDTPLGPPRSPLCRLVSARLAFALGGFLGEAATPTTAKVSLFLMPARMLIVGIQAPRQHETRAMLIICLQIPHSLADSFSKHTIFPIAFGIAVDCAVKWRFGIRGISSSEQFASVLMPGSGAIPLPSDVVRAPFFNLAVVSFGLTSTILALLGYVALNTRQLSRLHRAVVRQNGSLVPTRGQQLTIIDFHSNSSSRSGRP